MQFQVPQFIDIQPKIVGPLTLKQFFFLAAAFVPAFLLFFVLKFWLWILVAAVLISAAISIAFAKVNGRPLVKMLTAALNYFWQPRFYLWKHVEKRVLPKLPKVPKAKPETPAFQALLQKMRRSHEPGKAPERAEPALRTPLGDISLKLSTAANPIEEREDTSRFFVLFKTPRDRFETIRRTSGERAAARRVDFR